MGTNARRYAAVAGLAAAAVMAVGCSNGHSAEVSPPVALIVTSTTPSDEVTVLGERDVEVTLTGPIAAKYASSTAEQKAALGRPLTGDHNAGTRDSGVVFQQFQNGAIVAKNGAAGTPAYIVGGKIREAWNVQRDTGGVPAASGMNGSAGPLGVPTSDVTTTGELSEATFEHGSIAYDAVTGQIAVTVNGKVVPSGL